MNIKKAIESKDHEKVAEIAEKLLQEKSNEDTDFFLQHSKLVSLINLDKFDQALNYFKALESKFKQSPDYHLISNYFTYKNEKYEDVGNYFRTFKLENLSVAQKILFAQTEAKLENYLSAFRIFWSLYKEKAVQANLLEDCLINSINCLIVLILTEEDQEGTINNKTNLALLTEIIAFLARSDLAQFNSREAQINVLLLFIVIEKTKPREIYAFYKQVSFDFQEQANLMLQRIEQMIKDDAKVESSKSADLSSFLFQLQGERLIDHLTLFSLRTFIMQKNQEIVWNPNDIQAIEKLFFEDKNKINDDQLRISLISFLTFIYSIADAKNTTQINRILGKIEEELKVLPKNSKRSAFLTKHLLFNKTVLLLHNDNFQEAKKVAKSDLKINEKQISYMFLPIETQLIVKSRNPRELEAKLNAFDKTKVENDAQYACIFYLFQLTVYYNWNNQKKYSDVFLEFINNFFIAQLSIPTDQRFLLPSVFNQFTKHIVFFMIRNNIIMKSLKDKIIKFIDYIADPGIVLKMANLFIEKKDFEVAEKILAGLIQKDPSNDRIRSRLNYVYSVTNPHNIDEGVLPNFELIQDLNSLRNLENDFLNIIRVKSTVKTEQNFGKIDDNKIAKEKSTKKKIQKKYRIKWPKNFDFTKPGPRPDPERWLPKYERKKYLKRAVKEGKISRTQGVTTTSAQNKELFKVDHSTANQNVVKTKQKKK